MYYWSAEGGDTGSEGTGAGASEAAGEGEVERGVSVSTLRNVMSALSSFKDANITYSGGVGRRYCPNPRGSSY